jgi:hypothetical protein
MIRGTSYPDRPRRVSSCVPSDCLEYAQGVTSNRAQARHQAVRLEISVDQARAHVGDCVNRALLSRRTVRAEMNAFSLMSSQLNTALLRSAGEVRFGRPLYPTGLDRAPRPFDVIGVDNPYSR